MSASEGKGNPFEELFQPLKKSLDDMKTETWIKYVLPVQPVGCFEYIVPTIKTGLYLHALSEGIELHTYSNDDFKVKDLQEFISDIGSRVPIINRRESQQSTYIFCNDVNLVEFNVQIDLRLPMCSLKITTTDKNQLDYIKNLIAYNK